MKPLPPPMRIVIKGGWAGGWKPWAFAIGLQTLIVIAAVIIK
jgi:hypothetical protein